MLFTSEQGSNGHPDMICDQIPDVTFFSQVNANGCSRVILQATCETVQ